MARLSKLEMRFKKHSTVSSATTMRLCLCITFVLIVYEYHLIRGSILHRDEMEARSNADEFPGLAIFGDKESSTPTITQFTRGARQGAPLGQNNGEQKKSLQYSSTDTINSKSNSSTGSGSAFLQQKEDNIMNDEKAKRIAEKWDKARDTYAKGGAWHQHPLVVSTYKQRLAAGSESFVKHLLQTHGKRRKCLSIGCGDGGIEIEMVQGGLCESMKGIDLSPARIALATANIPNAIKDKVEFRVENAEKDINGQDYDLVLFTHSFHHIFDLESMAKALRDRIMDRENGGILVLEEYVGPVRWQFPKEHLDLMTNFLKDVEKEFPSYVKAIRQNGLWDGQHFVPPNADAVKKDDPSETVRSNEIIPVLSDYFTLVEDVALGGNFFQWMFQNAYNSLQDENGNKIVERMLKSEMEAIKMGKMKSDYVFQVWKHGEL